MHGSFSHTTRITTRRGQTGEACGGGRGEPEDRENRGLEKLGAPPEGGGAGWQLLSFTHGEHHEQPASQDLPSKHMPSVCSRPEIPRL